VTGRRVLCDVDIEKFWGEDGQMHTAVTDPYMNSSVDRGTRTHALDELLAPSSSVNVDHGAGNGDPEWLRCGDWRVLARARPREEAGEEVAQFVLEDGSVLSAWADPSTQTAWIPFDLEEAYLNFVYERWRGVTHQLALSEHQLEFFYRVKRFIPRSVQLRARRMLIRWQRNPEFPRWPFDDSVFQLMRFYARCLMVAGGRTELPFRWFWPERYRAAVTLTHDVESAEGLRHAIEIADLEEERGFRSSFNVVADWYPIDWGILRELRGRGFELGVHGLYHDRSMFSSREQFEQQQPSVREIAEKLGASGFRSPATHRVIEWLAELPVDYDCSVPHSDPFEPQPGGCCSVWPYFINGVVELPHTLPQDHTLFTLLGHRTIELWQRQLERIEELNGLIQVLTHPDPGYLAEPRNRQLYAELVETLRERLGLWRTLPRDVARWWRRRADPGIPGSFGLARLDGDEVVFEPPSS
jgi:peptidoglycan/xylan/chitin deacetylase (PgdA/CDA1 family)